jgi:hypothetical protein
MSKKPALTLRKPPSIDDFVAGAPRLSVAQTPERSDAQAPKSVITRADGRELRKLTVYLPAELAQRVRIHCVTHDIDISAYLARLTTESLGV